MKFTQTLLAVLLLTCMAGNAMQIAAATASETEAERAEDIDLQKILSETLDDSEYVETRRCLRSHEYKRVEILDSGHVLFHGRKNQVWLNKLRRNCSGLRKGLVLRFDLHGKRACQMDFFSGLNSFRDVRAPTAICVLGEFELVTDEQVAMLKESLAKQKNSKVLRSVNKANKAAAKRAKER